MKKTISFTLLAVLLSSSVTMASRTANDLIMVETPAASPAATAYTRLTHAREMIGETSGSLATPNLWTRICDYVTGNSLKDRLKEVRSTLRWVERSQPESYSNSRPVLTLRVDTPDSSRQITPAQKLQNAIDLTREAIQSLRPIPLFSLPESPLEHLKEATLIGTMGTIGSGLGWLAAGTPIGMGVGAATFIAGSFYAIPRIRYYQMISDLKGAIKEMKSIKREIRKQD